MKATKEEIQKISNISLKELQKIITSFENSETNFCKGSYNEKILLEFIKKNHEENNPKVKLSNKNHRKLVQKLKKNIFKTRKLLNKKQVIKTKNKEDEAIEGCKYGNLPKQIRYGN